MDAWKKYRRCGISLLLASVLLVSTTLNGCGSAEKNNNSVTESTEIDTDTIIAEESSTVRNSDEKQEKDNKPAVVKETNSELSETTENPTNLSYSWEDYVGDIETFVYGLINNQLNYQFDTFPAYVDLENGESVSGIGYTNYSECYTNEDESSVVFAAGFIPYIGEIEIPEEEIAAGQILNNLDYSDISTQFIWSDFTDSINGHFVVYNQYVKYGVNDAGQIYYEAQPYIKGHCDESLGSLYSYDEGKYLLYDDLGNYVNVKGESLISQIDYDELERQINAVLEEQDNNFASVDVTTCAYYSQNAVKAYLLSLQEETFMGCDVSELIKEVETLDPEECYRFTRDGVDVVDSRDTGRRATIAARWLVGTACAVTIAVGLVGSVVCIECPVLSSASGALAGAGIEIMMEVAISGNSPEDINWDEVGLAAATGAIAGYLGPYIMATTSGAGYFFADSTLDGMLGGIEQTTKTWLNGGDGKAMAASFGKGFALGFALSAGFKGAGKLVSKIADKVGPSVQKVSNKILAKFGKESGSASFGAATALGTQLKALKKAADSSPFHSEYISRNLAARQVTRLTQSQRDELFEKSYKSLKPDDIVDSNGKELSKQALKQLYEDADDNTVVAFYRINGQDVEIRKMNNMLGVFFDGETVTLPAGLTNDRTQNFIDAATVLKEEWQNDPDLIPASIEEAIRNSGRDLETITPRQLVDIIQSSDMVLHENIDLKTITLVSRALHDKAEGGISHMGGFALIKYLKNNMGTTYFERLISQAAEVAMEAAN